MTATAEPLVRTAFEELIAASGRAELIAGQIVLLPAKGKRATEIALRIYRSLHGFAELQGFGAAFSSSISYAVKTLASGRESFSPDASYFTGELRPKKINPITGAPDFAVEVLGETDSETDRVAKRADYFAAGTRIVWEVDPVASTISKYDSATPDSPLVYRRSGRAEAEPALLGWSVSVERLMG